MPHRARLLGMDTTTQRLVVALADGEVTVGIDEEGGARASSRLLPAVDELLRGAGLSLRDLDAIAFARGPGAFTGLRTAASAAQGLAFGLDLPVLPIDSLMVVAEDARLQAGALDVGTLVGVAADARMGEIYSATYAWRGDGWGIVDDAFLVEPRELLARWSAQPPTVIAGSALAVFADPLDRVAAARRVAVARDLPQALALLARRAWRDGATVTAAQAQPVYVRDKVAFTTREREAAKAAAKTDVRADVKTGAKADPQTTATSAADRTTIDGNAP